MLDFCDDLLVVGFVYEGEVIDEGVFEYLYV